MLLFPGANFIADDVFIAHYQVYDVLFVTNMFSNSRVKLIVACRAISTRYNSEDKRSHPIWLYALFPQTAKHLVVAHRRY